MSISVRGKEYDTMGDACRRLEISRSSMLRYIDDGFFTKPPVIRQGRGKTLRYFTEEWYGVNAPKLNKSTGNY
jgi:hypothetical protein